MLFSLRYESPEGQTQEYFLKFLPIQSHAREALYDSVIKVLKGLTLILQTAVENAMIMLPTCLG